MLEIIFWVLDIIRDTARQIRFSVSDNPLATVFSLYINKFTSVIALFLPLPLVAAFIKEQDHIYEEKKLLQVTILAFEK